jgi:hypothetical protein
MDKETIQQIAAEVAARLPFGDRYWLFLLVNAGVMAVVGAVAALGTSYFKTRGQNLATKHDFNELLKQQKDTAEAVKTIKSDVGQRVWAQRERTTLRRIKLEALLEKMHECEEYLDRRRDRAQEGMAWTPERDPVSEFDVLAPMFPELGNEARRFSLICSRLLLLSSTLANGLIKSRDDQTAHHERGRKRRAAVTTKDATAARQ